MSHNENVVKKVRIKGTYTATRSSNSSLEFTSGNWERISKEHEPECPWIHSCAHGTFNVQLREPTCYEPPLDKELRALAKRRGRGNPNDFQDGNHLSPLAWVVELNSTPVKALIYRGGHPDSVLELISEEMLSEVLHVSNGDEVTLVIEELWTPISGMPQPPRY